MGNNNNNKIDRRQFIQKLVGGFAVVSLTPKVIYRGKKKLTERLEVLPGEFPQDKIKICGPFLYETKEFPRFLIPPFDKIMVDSTGESLMVPFEYKGKYNGEDISVGITYSDYDESKMKNPSLRDNIGIFSTDSRGIADIYFDEESELKKSLNKSMKIVWEHIDKYDTGAKYRNGKPIYSFYIDTNSGDGFNEAYLRISSSGIMKKIHDYFHSENFKDLLLENGVKF